MAKSKPSILKATPPKKTVGFRIDPRIEKELTQLTHRLEREAPHLTFDKSAIVQEALRAAIASANAELDALNGVSHA